MRQAKGKAEAVLGYDETIFAWCCKKLGGHDKNGQGCGDFNIGMANAYLVVLNEVGRKGFDGATGEIKSLITDPTMIVEKKHVDRQEIDSYHRFIFTAQVKDGEAIPTTDDERRYCIMRCSDELCAGHKDDHVAWAALIKRDSAIKDFYEYLMSRTPPAHILR